MRVLFQIDGEAGGAVVNLNLVPELLELKLLDVLKSEDCRRSDSGLTATGAANLGS